MQASQVAMVTVAMYILISSDVTRTCGDATTIIDMNKNFSALIAQIERNLSESIIQEEHNPTMQRLQRIRKVRLKSLNFHINNKIYLTNALLSLGDIKVHRSDVDMYGHRMDIRITLPALQVDGLCRFGTSTLDDARFRLTMDRISAEGVASMSPSDTPVPVEWLHLTTFKHDTTQLQIVSLQNDKRDASDLISELDSVEFKNLLIKKFERDIISKVSQFTMDKLNDILRRRASLIMSPYTTVIQDYIVNSTESANTFIDTLLRFGGELIKEKFGDQVKIPDIDESFSRKLAITLVVGCASLFSLSCKIGIFLKLFMVILVTWRGSFKARKGSAIGISNVYRIGDTAFGTDNESLLHFYGTLGFTQLRLYYDYYKAELLGLGPSGTLDTKLEPVALFVHVHVNITSSMIYMDEFKVENVGDLDVYLTGLGGLLNWLVSLVTTWVVGLFRDEILGQLESQYKQYATDIFASYSIEELINGGQFL